MRQNKKWSRLMKQISLKHIYNIIEDSRKKYNLRFQTNWSTDTILQLTFHYKSKRTWNLCEVLFLYDRCSLRFWFYSVKYCIQLLHRHKNNNGLTLTTYVFLKTFFLNDNVIMDRVYKGTRRSSKSNILPSSRILRNYT